MDKIIHEEIKTEFIKKRDKAQSQIEENWDNLENRHRKIRKLVLLIACLSFFFFAGQGILLDSQTIADGTQSNIQESSLLFLLIIACAEIIPMILIIFGVLFWYIGPMKKIYELKFAGELIPDDQYDLGMKRFKNLIPLMNVLLIILYFSLTALSLRVTGKNGVGLFLDIAPKITLGLGLLIFSDSLIDFLVLRHFRKTFDFTRFDGKVNFINKISNQTFLTPIIFLLNGLFIIIDAVLKMVTGAGSRFDVNRERFETLFRMDQGGRDFVDAIEKSGAVTNLENLNMTDIGEMFSGLVFLSILILIPTIAVFASLAMSQKAKLKDLDDKIIELARGSGDLTKKIKVQSEDELALITSHLNDFTESLRQKLKIISESSGKVSHSSHIMYEHLENTSAATEEMVASVNQISRTTTNRSETIFQTGEQLVSIIESLDRVSSSVEHQAAFVDQTSSAINEMAASISSVTQSTRTASELSLHLKSAAREGEAAVNESITAVRAVESSSEEVNSLVSLITDTADTTNLLAMNAAIEAAHAGDAGKGFAVVADEVRRLAEDSSDGAKQITHQIQTMVDVVGQGVKLSEEAGSSLTKVIADVEETTRVIEGITMAMDEQNTGANDILQSISSLVEATATIREVTSEQKKKNEEIRQSVDMIVQAFNEINLSTEEQALGANEIVTLISALQDVAHENQSVVETLQEAFSGFTLD